MYMVVTVRHSQNLQQKLLGKLQKWTLQAVSSALLVSHLHVSAQQIHSHLPCRGSWQPLDIASNAIWFNTRLQSPAHSAFFHSHLCKKFHVSIF